MWTQLTMVNLSKREKMAEGITEHPWTWNEFLMFKCIGHEI